MDIAKVPLFILAGGRATRLGHLSEALPKYLMPIGGEGCEKGQAFADIHLAWAFQQGFRRVILSVGYLADQIVQYCGDGKRWGLEIEYVFDGTTALGTGGASLKSLQFSFDFLAVTYGDTLLQVNAKDCLEELIPSNHLACMTVYKNKVPGHICNANLVGKQALYDKKNPQKNWQFIDYGFSIFKRSFIEGFSREVPLDLAEPLAKISRQGQLLGIECSERFWEIGSPEALVEFRQSLITPVENKNS